MNRKMSALLLCLALVLSGCSHATSEQPTGSPTETAQPAADTSAVTEAMPAETAPAVPDKAPDVKPDSIAYMARPALLSDAFSADGSEGETSVNWQTPASDLSNVYVGGYEYAVQDAKCKQLLAENGFYLEPGFMPEFFEDYERNRYDLRANYVTVDSMMHTYHLYFSYLLKKLEREHLSKELLDVSEQMLAAAQSHYEALKGTEWETAAKTELAFFAVGASLLDSSASVPDAVQTEVSSELQKISDAGGIALSDVMEGVQEDYTQYIPRGYYDSSEELKRYFKAMMWYGRMGFTQDNDTLNRASVLITLAMDGDALAKWEHIYTVTSFFAGTSDDFGYYEEKPVIDAVYGKDCTAESLVGKEEHWNAFQELCRHLPSPVINSVPVYAADSDEEAKSAQKGFRFMGQRFSIDESCFTKLCYRQVKESDSGERRLLPDALDFPAALGSDTALQILEDAGKTDYPNYDDQMKSLRTSVHNAAKSTWTASLYSSWIYTLRPLLDEKNESYPPFMRSEAWLKKSLMTFESSYAELKHDTILYSKQFMGEMGGGEIPDYDDRGFVEAEPLVFARLRSLVESTSEGLSGYQMLDAHDRQNLDILAELAGKLQTIAEKELKGVLPDEEEFELIRTYGGQLEHFWQEVMDGEFPEEKYHSVDVHPSPIIADIATDPNGWCLEVGTGKPMRIYVIVEVDGKLKIASGMTYSFYQFEQPASERLTDTEWHGMLGMYPDEDGVMERDKNLRLPDWYRDIVYVSPYEADQY
ncbi:MAG: DUF3160 domain-containing protein [Oscillospiraceae bacterium]|nr:DUF3160 domain-containing protein [Oscillospiraceae bacterium]